MYCPLCLSEFRGGFSTCSDCHAALVNHSNYLRLLGIPVGKRKPTIEYQVWIFGSDLARVRKAVAPVLHAASKGEER